MDHSQKPDQAFHSREDLDPVFQQQLQRLHEMTVYSRWLVVGGLWLTVGIASLWTLRDEFALWMQYFTWTAVRYSLSFHRFAALGLAICVGSTVGVLVWQSRNILWGLSKSEQMRLRDQLMAIRRQGASHPLWQWICHDQA